MTDSTNQSACCGAAPRLIFACSGAADVGQIADLAARKLAAEGAGKMFCLAGIGGRVSGILATTQAAAAILAIDGCPLDCARQTLQQAGFTRFEHLRLSDLGIEKGRSPATDLRVSETAARGKMLLSGAQTQGSQA